MNGNQYRDFLAAFAYWFLHVVIGILIATVIAFATYGAVHALDHRQEDRATETYRVGG